MFWEGRIPIATAADADFRTAHDPMTFGVGGCAQVTMRSMNHQVIIGAYWAYLFGSVAGLDLSPTLRPSYRAWSAKADQKVGIR
jgi:hypothetical protein